MLERLVSALIIIAVGLCGYMAVIHWDDDRHPLIIEASASCPPPMRLPNPCGTVNCNRIDTRRIA